MAAKPKSKSKPKSQRQILDEFCEDLKRKAGSGDMEAALLEPEWKDGDAPGTEWLEYAEIGPYELMALKTTAALHAQAPPGAARISWSLAIEEGAKELAGGEASSREEAKEYAYVAYQAANGYLSRAH